MNIFYVKNVCKYATFNNSIFDGCKISIYEKGALICILLSLQISLLFIQMNFGKAKAPYNL